MQTKLLWQQKPSGESGKVQNPSEPCIQANRGKIITIYLTIGLTGIRADPVSKRMRITQAVSDTVGVNAIKTISVSNDGYAVATHIRHAYIKPRTPRLNGKVERSHGTDQREFYQLLEYTDDVDLHAKLAEWEAFYNYHRPHTSLKGKTPYERLREKMRQSRFMSACDTCDCFNQTMQP